MTGFRESPQFGGTAAGWEQKAREDKASHIITHARQQGISSADIHAMDDTQRMTLLNQAGTGHAADDTWALVHQGLGAIESKPAPDDPFAGL